MGYLLHTTREEYSIHTSGPSLLLAALFNMTAVALSLSRHQDLDRPAATSWSRFEFELPLPKR